MYGETSCKVIKSIYYFKAVERTKVTGSGKVKLRFVKKSSSKWDMYLQQLQQAYWVERRTVQPLQAMLKLLLFAV